MSPGSSTHRRNLQWRAISIEPVSLHSPYHNKRVQARVEKSGALFTRTSNFFQRPYTAVTEIHKYATFQGTGHSRVGDIRFLPSALISCRAPRTGESIKTRRMVKPRQKKTDQLYYLLTASIPPTKHLINFYHPYMVRGPSPCLSTVQFRRQTETILETYFSMGLY